MTYRPGGCFKGIWGSKPVQAFENCQKVRHFSEAGNSNPIDPSGVVF